MFIWVIAALTAGLLSTALFAMNRSLQNAISPLFEAGRVQQTVAPPSPGPAPVPTPIVLASPTTVPAADPLVGVAFAAPLDGTAGTAVTQAPVTIPAPRAPAHATRPKVLAAAKPLVHAAVVAGPAPDAALPLNPPAKPVRAEVELAAALHSPIQTESIDMANITPLTPPALAAIVLPIPRVTSVPVTPVPTPPPTRHHHGNAVDSAGTNADGQNGRRG